MDINLTISPSEIWCLRRALKDSARADRERARLLREKTDHPVNAEMAKCYEAQADVTDKLRGRVHQDMPV